MRESVRAVVIKNECLLVMKRNKTGREYYALIGGGIDPGETAEEALHREIAEETGITVANPRLVVNQIGGPKFGRQYIYLCNYVSGKPALAADSVEAVEHAKGQNLYTPMWLPVAELPNVEFLPRELQAVLIEYLAKGFPESPASLKITE